jgi:signal transduction histidine kinase
VAASTRDGEVCVTVSDHGIGIPPDEINRVFERFHRAPNIDQGISGLGLGLYIAREIVRAHGGEIIAASEPGVGSAFTVTLPAASPTS